jgi:hypothetical protein
MRLLVLIAAIVLLGLFVRLFFPVRHSLRTAEQLTTDQTSGLKMAIVTWFDDAIREYAFPTWRANCMYGKRHGIDAIRSSQFRTDRSVMWQRVPLLKERLHAYDYLMWCDADAVFSPWAPNIKNYLAAHGFPDAIVTEDFPGAERYGVYQEKLSHEDAVASNLNSGVVFIKNSAAGHNLLELWSDEALHGPRVTDQCVLRLLYSKYLNKTLGLDCGQIIKIPYGELQWFPTSAIDEARLETPEFIQTCCTEKPGFIWHCAGKPAHVRNAFFQRLQQVASRGAPRRRDRPRRAAQRRIQLPELRRKRRSRCSL